MIASDYLVLTISKRYEYSQWIWHLFCRKVIGIVLAKDESVQKTCFIDTDQFVPNLIPILRLSIF